MKHWNVATLQPEKTQLASNNDSVFRLWLIYEHNQWMNKEVFNDMVRALFVGKKKFDGSYIYKQEDYEWRFI